MRSHPNWYYRRYNDVFSRREGYEQDIVAIQNIISLSGKAIQEIGAGTGEHAERILACDVAHLDLVDDDPVAVRILHERFMGRREVSIILANGFEEFKWPREYDVVIAMYSIILQNVVNEKHLINRIHKIISRLSKKGVGIFEWIDASVSQRVYPQGAKSVIFSQGNEYVLIESNYYPGVYSIKYTGFLEGQHINYQVSLLAITRNRMIDILSNIASSVHCKFGIVPLERSERRMLAYIKR